MALARAKSTFCIWYYLAAKIDFTRKPILSFRIFSRKKKHCSTRDEKASHCYSRVKIASQILAIFSHATFVSNMNFENYSGIYPGRGFSPKPMYFQGHPQSRLHFPAGILRIPVFSVPVALFPQESWFLFRRNFFLPPQKSGLYRAYVRSRRKLRRTWKRTIL